MNSIQQRAYAKLNLTLGVRCKRADGYHELDMLMQQIDLCDTLTVSRATDVAVTGSGMLLPFDNSIRAAANYYRALTGRGAHIHVAKRIPAEAGLGGGSADVAALLRILRDAYAPALSTAELERIGLTVGSDMPFCVHGGTCLAEGRGEVLTDLAPLPACHLVLCKPDFGIPTPTLFARVDGGELTHRPDIGGMCAALEGGDLPGVASRLGNVFEAVLPPEYHEVFRIKERLLALGAMNAVMSGSGPTVFGLFARREDALRAERTLKETYRQTYLAVPVKKFD